MQGALTILDRPDAAALKELTARVYRITPYSDAHKLAPPNAPKDSPIPRRVGSPSPIKHVFYVIRENRTFDQVLGDLGRGNGDPSLAIFGEEITPNAHAIAREFATFDNFYVDAEVSYDGHAFSTGAYATDIVEKMWPTNYGGRGGLYLSEGGWAKRNPYGNIAAPPEGYLWDFATARRDHLSQLWRVRRLGPAGWQRHRDRARPRGPRPPLVSARTTCRFPTTRASTSGSRSFVSSRPMASSRASTSSVSATTIPPAPVPARRRRARWWPRTIRRSDGWSRRSPTAATGRNRPSSSSKTMRRTDRTTSTRIARCCSSPAPSSSAARGQHALHHVGRAADDGAGAGTAADEPVRRRGDADVRRVPADAEPRAVHGCARRASRSPRRTIRARPARRRRWR